MSLSKRQIIILAVVAVAAVVLVGFNIFRQSMIESYFASAERPPVTVSARTAEPVVWRPGLQAVGTAKAAQGVNVAVEVGGIVDAILFRSNEQAEAGQVLVRIDDDIEQAEMIAVRANIKLYETELERTGALRSKGFSTQASYDDARAQLEVARSQLARLEAVTQQKSIRAPFSGVLGIVRVDHGQYVQPGTVVVTLQDLDHMRVDFTVPEQSVHLLSLGQPVEIRLETLPDSFSGRITGIDPKVDPQTRLISIRAEVANPERRILPGQFVRVRVELPPEKGVLALPQTAVVASLYGDYVYVVEGREEDDQLQIRQAFVDVGRRDNGLVEITGGIDAGMMVVDAGQNRLQNRARVIIDNTVDLMRTGVGAGGGQ